MSSLSSLFPVTHPAPARAGKEESSMSDPRETSSPPHEQHKNMSSHASVEPQASPGAPGVAPTASIEEPSTSGPSEIVSLQTTAKPQPLPAAPDIASNMPQTIESDAELSSETVLTTHRFNGPQTSPLSSDSTFTFTFPIMKLPPELRLVVFDQLFLDLTVCRQNRMMYCNQERMLRKHKVNDFRPYTNLLLTSKELNNVAKKLWEERYLHQCCFYFWHVWKLYDFANVVDKLGKPYTEIGYVLRSRHEEADEMIKPFCVAGEVARIAEGEADTFMGNQPGAPSDYPLGLIKQANKRLYAAEGTHEASNDISLRTMVYKTEKSFVRSECSGPESCTLTVSHAVTPLREGTCRIDGYRQMHGKFSGIFWGGYDAAVSYGIFRLWEVSDPCNDYCQCREWQSLSGRLDCDRLNEEAKDVRQQLFELWYDEITRDLTWLALRGKMRSAMPADLLYDYGMTDWFDDETWFEFANDFWLAWLTAADEEEDFEHVSDEGEDEAAGEIEEEGQ
jgi:hypothetical protein